MKFFFFLQDLLSYANHDALHDLVSSKIGAGGISYYLQTVENKGYISYKGKRNYNYCTLVHLIGSSCLPNEGKIFGYSWFKNLNIYIYNKLGKSDPYYIPQQYDKNLNFVNHSIDTEKVYYNLRHKFLYIKNLELFNESNRTDNSIVLNEIPIHNNNNDVAENHFKESKYNLLGSHLIKSKNSKIDQQLFLDNYKDCSLKVEDEFKKSKSNLLGSILIKFESEVFFEPDLKDYFINPKQNPILYDKTKELHKRFFIKGAGNCFIKKCDYIELKEFDNWQSVIQRFYPDLINELSLPKNGLFLLTLDEELYFKTIGRNKYYFHPKPEELETKEEMIAKLARSFYLSPTLEVSVITVQVFDDRSLSVTKDIDGRLFRRGLTMQDFREILRDERLSNNNFLLYQLQNLKKNQINLRFNLMFLDIIHKREFFRIYKYVNLHKFPIVRTYDELLDYEKFTKKRTLKCIRDITYETIGDAGRRRQIINQFKIDGRALELKYLTECFENIENPYYKERLLQFLTNNYHNSQDELVNEFFLIEIIRCLKTKRKLD